MYKIGEKIRKDAHLDEHIAFSQAVNDYNSTCKAGDMLWAIRDDGDEYIIVANGIREG
jgi:hypothetical protein